MKIVSIILKEIVFLGKNIAKPPGSEGTVCKCKGEDVCKFCKIFC